MQCGSRLFQGLLFLFFAVHLLTAAQTGINLTDNELIQIGSPYLIFQTQLVLSLFGLLPALIFVVQSIVRDYDKATVELFFTTPVDARSWLLGPFRWRDDLRAACCACGTAWDRGGSIHAVARTEPHRAVRPRAVRGKLRRDRPAQSARLLRDRVRGSSIDKVASLDLRCRADGRRRGSGAVQRDDERRRILATVRRSVGWAANPRSQPVLYGRGPQHADAGQHDGSRQPPDLARPRSLRACMGGGSIPPHASEAHISRVARLATESGCCGTHAADAYGER